MYTEDAKMQKLKRGVYLHRGNTGLLSLSRELLGVEMDKAFHVQCGNWEAHELSERQVRILFAKLCCYKVIIITTF